MRFTRLFVMAIALLYLVPFTFAQSSTTAPADTVRLIYFVPSDRSAQSDIDSNIDTWIKDTQTAYAEVMEAHGYGSKTFTLETDDEGDAVVHHITGDYTDAYYETNSKWEVWDEIKEEGFDPSQNIYVAFVDLSSEMIDGWCGTGGDWTNANGGVVTLPASGDCYVEDDGGDLKEVNLIAHELGHALGLRHDYRNHSDISTDITLKDSMVTSACAAKWLDGHRYFNSYTTTSPESTTIELATSTISGSDFTFTFTITDADGLHQAHFFTTRYDTYDFNDLSLLDCKSLDSTSTSATATFTTSALTLSNDSVTLRVMDATGSMTEELFSVNLTTLLADVNRDGTVDILDLTQVVSNLGQQGENSADVNRDGVVDNTDLTLVAGVFGSTTDAPSVSVDELGEPLTKANLQKWLREARQMNLKDPTFQRGILVLEQLLAALTPTKAMLLPNYPNPFNPETWIPYQLSEAAAVTITIYDVVGSVVRSLDLGHRAAGYYHNRSQAAYWDGRNTLNERVASGIYFYQIQAGEFSATRRMLILK